MRVNGVLIVVSMHLVSAPFSGAETQQPGSNCEAPKDAQEVMTCALKKHPAVLTASIGEQQASELESVAAQRPNPELDTQFAFGDNMGDTVVNTDTTLAHVWELGGKRGARIERAKAEKELATATLQEAKETVAFEVAESLYRLRQIAVEKSVLEEALQSFTSITSALRKRPVKNPEQEASLLIYDIARTDYRLRRSGLESEERSEIKKLELAIGASLTSSKHILPKPRTKWPVLKPETETLGGAQWKRTQADLQQEEAGLALAQSDSWPDLRIGPTLQTETQGPATVNTFGFALALPLPIYQHNSAGRAHARLGVSKAQAALDAVRKTLKSEYEREVENYRTAVMAIQESKSSSELEREHKKMEDLIDRGLIQSSLVIEAHRQMFDLTRSTHELELNALRSLLKVRRIEGRLLEETI